MATMFAYGFFGNIIQQSDQWRFFGPLRYILSGVFQFIRNTSYHTELTITQASEKCSTKVPNKNLNRYGFDNSIKRRELSSESSEIDKRIDSEKSSSPLQIKHEGYYRTINCLNMPCRCENSKYGMSPSVHLGMKIIYMNK
jgi:ceramide kinase